MAFPTSPAQTASAALASLPAGSERKVGVVQPVERTRELVGQTRAACLAEVDPGQLPLGRCSNLFQHLVERAQAGADTFGLELAVAGALPGRRRTPRGDVYCPRVLGEERADVWLWHQDEPYTWSFAAHSFSELDAMFAALAQLWPVRSRLEAALARLDVAEVRSLSDLDSRLETLDAGVRGAVGRALCQWLDLGDPEPPLDYEFTPLREARDVLLADLRRDTLRRLRVTDPFARSGWLVAGLVGERPDPPPDASDALEQALDGATPLPVSDALYLLWWSWLLGSEHQAFTMLARTADHPVRLVSDAAALVDQLLDGRSTIGGVDIGALRAHLRAPRGPAWPRLGAR